MTASSSELTQMMIVIIMNVSHTSFFVIFARSFHNKVFLHEKNKSKRRKSNVANLRVDSNLSAVIPLSFDVE